MSNEVKQEIKTLISTKQILIPFFENDLTASTSVCQRIFNDMVRIEERLIKNYGIMYIHGKSIEYLKNLLIN